MDRRPRGGRSRPEPRSHMLIACLDLSDQDHWMWARAGWAAGPCRRLPPAPMESTAGTRSAGSVARRVLSLTSLTPPPPSSTLRPSLQHSPPPIPSLTRPTLPSGRTLSVGHFLSRGLSPMAMTRKPLAPASLHWHRLGHSVSTLSSAETSHRKESAPASEGSTGSKLVGASQGRTSLSCAIVIQTGLVQDPQTPRTPPQEEKAVRGRQREVLSGEEPILRDQELHIYIV